MPSREDIETHILSSLNMYWSKNSYLIRELPVTQATDSLKIFLPLKLVEIHLPSWASECGVDGKILVPIETTKNNDFTPHWSEVDWFAAAFLMLEGWHERVWEEKNGPIHSYSFRLRGWDERAWEHAWVNRIALFLRSWAAHNKNLEKNLAFERVSNPVITVTHDVDAIKKTLPIRLKQSAFFLINAMRSLYKLNFLSFYKNINKSLLFLFSNDNWWQFEKLLKIEDEAQIKSIFHFYSDPRKKSFKSWFFDPSYDFQEEKVLSLVSKLKQESHEIGIHPSYDSWNDCRALEIQRKYFNDFFEISHLCCRQHWLRFSWSDTWVVQDENGTTEDRTLMFNDRPGFRNSSAISWFPWNPKSNKAHTILAQASILMDSHLYDYLSLTTEQRTKQINYWISEVKIVSGSAAVLWHPHTLSSDYGWTGGFEILIDKITKTFPK